MDNSKRVVNTFDDISKFRLPGGSGEYDFSNVIFNCEADFRNTNILLSNFQNAVFNKNVYIDDQCLTNDNIYFEDAKFKKKLFFRSVTITDSVYFNRCIFYDDVHFERTTYGILADFQNAIFKGNCYFDFCDFKKKSDFSNARFENKVSFSKANFASNKNGYERLSDFSNAKFSNLADFSESIFHRDVLFTDIKFLGEANFANAEFHWHTKFTNTEFWGKTKFKKVKFEFSLNCHAATFKNETDFVLTEFQLTNFNKTHFFKNTFFDYAKFSGDTLFDEIKFNNVLQFNRAHFKELVNFRYILSKNGNLRFENASFDGLFNLSDSRLSKINFTNTLFNGNVNFTNSKFCKTDLKGVFFNKAGLFKDFSILESNRESFRILKHELLKTNNKIDALTYHKKEMSEYWKELRKDYWVRHFSDLFVLFMNRISNNYGLSWWRGVIFTFLTALLFFVPYLFCLKNPYFSWVWENWPAFWQVIEKTLKYYVEFFYAAHKFNFMEQYEPNGIAYVLDMVGRIFITYGYYQTIQAFRKYGKW